MAGNSASTALKALTGCTGDRLLNIHRDGRFDHWKAMAPVFSSMRLSVAGSKTATWPDTGAHGGEGRSIETLLPLLETLRNEGALICAATEGEAEGETEEEGKDGPLDAMHRKRALINGIVLAHGYTLLDVRSNVASSGVDLLQLRNPHSANEWKGAWGDESPEWAEHPSVKALLRPEVRDDGVFWISKEDFAMHFEAIYICRFDEEARRQQADEVRAMKAIRLQEESDAIYG